MTTPKKKFETKKIRHTFTQEERNGMSEAMLQAMAEKESADGELEQIKASYKAKIASAEATVGHVATSLRAGFEFRDSKLWVSYDAAAKLKHYRRENQDETVDPVLTEPMLPEDFQRELELADAQFEDLREVPLWTSANDDNGRVIIARGGEKWAFALRLKVGPHAIEQRLDASKLFKKREDCVAAAGKAALQWLKDTLGEENAEGFKAGILNAVDVELGN